MHGIINSPELYESTAIAEDKKDRLRVASKDLAAGIDYDELNDSITGLVQTIVYKLSSVTIRTITITYTNSCKDQYTMVVA